jgi:hypothetical protein
VILGKYLQGIHEEKSLDTHWVSWIKKHGTPQKMKPLQAKTNADAYRHFVF